MVMIEHSHTICSRFAWPKVFRYKIQIKINIIARFPNLQVIEYLYKLIVPQVFEAFSFNHIKRVRKRNLNNSLIGP
uniref:Uncharacterized protein n=1 Tax=Paenibacillus athensensis TaxID=1967502 RepID=A0A4Y8Q8Q6_9BACL